MREFLKTILTEVLTAVTTAGFVGPFRGSDEPEPEATRRRYDNPRHATLTPAQVREIRALLKAGAKQQDLADEYGVHQGTISCIKTGRTWSNVK